MSRRDWMRLVNRYGRRCAYCLTPCANPHMEHVIPLARGGRDAIGNTLPVCQACNQSKNKSLLIEWRIRRRKADLPLPGLGDAPLSSGCSPDDGPDEGSDPLGLPDMVA